MSNEEMKLLFPFNQANELQGLNNSGVETFMDNPYSGMARELGQNSIDVRKNKDAPVLMRFKKIELPTSAIPDVDNFKRITDLCLKTSTDRENKKEIAFFRKAKTMLGHDTIPVLEVSDYNTTGASEKGFQALTGEGETEKDNIDSGGSFGIGKSAGFAVSDLRTVFYSTRHPEGDRTQGKTLFRSHQDNEHDGEESRQAKGYWGNSYGPLLNDGTIPEWMRRSEVGTSVFALGMRPSNVPFGEDAWAYETLTVLAINFFAAIHCGVVEFHMDKNGKDLRLDKRTVRDLIEHSTVSQTAEKIALFDQLERSRALYKCVSAPDAAVHIEEFDIHPVGKFKARLLMEDGLGNKVGILRNGIFIADNLKHFGHGFSGFPLYRDFAIIIEPANDVTSAMMKRLENPSHDALTPSRIIDVKERDEIEKGYKLLGKRIRNFIKSHAKTKIADEQDLDEMNEFFNSDDEVSDRDGDENSITKIRVSEVKVNTPRPQTRRKQKAKSSKNLKGGGEHGEDGRRGKKSNGENEGDGKGAEAGDGDRKVTDYRHAYIRDPRIIRGTSGVTSRTIKFTPEDSGLFRVSVSAEGINESVYLPVSVPGAAKFENHILVPGTKGDRISVDLDLLEDYNGAITVSCEVTSNKGPAR